MIQASKLELKLRIGSWAEARDFFSWAQPQPPRQLFLTAYFFIAHIQTSRSVFCTKKQWSTRRTALPLQPTCLRALNSWSLNLCPRLLRMKRQGYC